MNARIFPAHRHAGAGLAALAVAAAGWALLPHAGRQSTLRLIDDICSSVSRPMFSSAPAPEGSAAAARPQTSSRVISCEALPNVPGKSVTTVIVDFPPMAYSPAHRHPGSVTAIILDGTVRSQLAGTPAGDYKSGETFFEPPGTLHLFAENPDPVKPARLVAVFVAEENCGPLLLPP
ncbi:cupin domain-containing protein [Variovorax sp. NFACC27]|jgi:quercetin dioxygenase-like cupin family protein|uniref:cupin domain-containing protein n=1 Tax=unclassified Variovorax TaxID=663243 RepID=UPI00089D604F|nr:Cupin domain protein [Variovorax sp. NFACC28]SEG84761.1 Cupin domain protein [Variovorax sp. NFACC29]SFD18391.1 Cupin domain protein [Variovorax sp. NFACC26]SFG25660.1 Cupin domain protein [Variovorax sp. NFACC27]